jgi:hypothetical protein
MLLAAVVVGVVIGSCLALRINRRRRTPAELRGDWWARFEDEFRAYTTRLERSRRPRRRRSDHGSIG